MRALSVLLALGLLTGCDLFDSDDGSFSAQVTTADSVYQYEGIALYRDDIEVPTVFLRDGDELAFVMEAPGGFREGDVSVSRASSVTLRNSSLGVERTAVSGTIVIESVTGDEVAGTIDVGLSSFGSNDPSRFLRGTFRAVR